MTALAFVAERPSQYLGPMLRQLAQHVPLHVFYDSLGGAESAFDPEFQTSFSWDVATLHGYPWERANVAAVPWRLREFDAIIVHGVNRPIHWGAFWGAWHWGKRLLLRGEFMPTCRFPRLRRWLFGRIDGFLAIGTVARDTALEFGVPENRIWMSPYAVDNDFFALRASQALQPPSDKRIIRERYGLSQELPMVTMVGKLTSRKRPMDLLTACRGLDCSVLFVGDGPERPALEREIRRVHARAAITGFINQTMLPAYYAAADIFVMPSAWESWGLSANEAMACGLPIILSEGVAATRDLIRGNGYTFPPGDIKRLRVLIRHLLLDDEERLEMGARSREIVRGFSIERAVAGILEALR